MIANKARPACLPVSLVKESLVLFLALRILFSPNFSHQPEKILNCLTTLHRQFTFLNHESVRTDLHTLHSSWKYLSHTTTIFGHQNTSPKENKLRVYFCMRNTSRVRKEKFKNKVGRAFLCCFHNASAILQEVTGSRKSSFEKAWVLYMS